MFFALEFEDLPVQVLETCLLAAAGYIKWAAQDFLIEGQKINCYPSPLQTKRGLEETGPWGFWESRMAALNHDESLHQEVRTEIEASLQLMTKIKGAAYDKHRKVYVEAKDLSCFFYHDPHSRTRRSSNLPLPCIHPLQSSTFKVPTPSFTSTSHTCSLTLTGHAGVSQYLTFHHCTAAA